MPRRRVLVLSALATCAPVALSYSPWRSLPRSAVLTLASRERRTKARAVATGDATETAAAISEYDHTAMEAKWQQYWEAQNTFATRRREGKDKKYVLDMFPYPSGAGLHVGHPEGYALTLNPNPDRNPNRNPHPTRDPNPTPNQVHGVGHYGALLADEGLRRAAPDG